MKPTVSLLIIAALGVVVSCSSTKSLRVKETQITDDVMRIVAQRGNQAVVEITPVTFKKRDVTYKEGGKRIEFFSVTNFVSSGTPRTAIAAIQITNMPPAVATPVPAPPTSSTVQPSPPEVTNQPAPAVTNPPPVNQASRTNAATLNRLMRESNRGNQAPAQIQNAPKEPATNAPAPGGAQP